MSAKRGMSKQQRLYYEYQNKDRIKEQLQELAKEEQEHSKKELFKPYHPYDNSYFT